MEEGAATMQVEITRETEEETRLGLILEIALSIAGTILEDGRILKFRSLLAAPLKDRARVRVIIRLELMAWLLCTLG